MVVQCLLLNFVHLLIVQLKKRNIFPMLRTMTQQIMLLFFFFSRKQEKHSITSTFRVEGSLAGMNEPWKILKMFL